MALKSKGSGGKHLVLVCHRSLVSSTLAPASLRFGSHQCVTFQARAVSAKPASATRQNGLTLSMLPSLGPDSQRRPPHTKRFLYTRTSTSGMRHTRLPIMTKTLLSKASPFSQCFLPSSSTHLFHTSPLVSHNDITTSTKIDAWKLNSPQNSASTLRRFATATKSPYPVIFERNDAEGRLRVHDGHSFELSLPYIWLRDHCRSPVCYNHDTHQKVPATNLSMEDLTPQLIESDKDGSGLTVIWRDGHSSHYSFAWLAENAYPGCLSRKAKPFLWDRATIESRPLPVVNCQEHLSSEEGLRKSLSNLVTYGFTLVDQAPVSVEGTKQVVERLAFVLKTLFGEMWTFTSDGTRSDTAYSSQALGAHTDMTYMNLPAGIQVFQCLEHTGTGGETLLVDGFKAMHTLRLQEPDAFNTLSSTIIPHEYKEEKGPNSPGYHLYSLGTVISQHPASKALIQLRFNPYDRAPLDTVAPEAMNAFYHAYDKLSQIISDQRNEFWVKLRPGTVLLIDNWRVMHGRAAFDGRRMMCGCYLPRDEWISRARLLGVF